MDFKGNLFFSIVIDDEWVNDLFHWVIISRRKVEMVVLPSVTCSLDHGNQNMLIQWLYLGFHLVVRALIEVLIQELCVGNKNTVWMIQEYKNRDDNFCLFEHRCPRRIENVCRTLTFIYT